jgi:Pyridoxamine 5'-phosphate oxidase
MPTNEPTPKNLGDLYDLPTIEWSTVRSTIEGFLSQAPGTGGPDHHTFWLSTVDPNGRPHQTGVGAFWDDGRYYFCGGAGSRKIRNVENEPRCSFAVSLDGFDVSLEGRAERVTSGERLEQLAKLFAKGGWAPTVADGGFTHEFSAPSAGPPPWFVYAFTPEVVYAVMTKEPGGATRWTF